MRWAATGTQASRRFTVHRSEDLASAGLFFRACGFLGALAACCAVFLLLTGMTESACGAFHEDGDVFGGTVGDGRQD